jgi:hypothetical protein
LRKRPELLFRDPSAELERIIFFSTKNYALLYIFYRVGSASLI